MMEKYTNDYGKECYRGVTPDTVINETDFHFVAGTGDETQMALHTDMGSLTVLDRMTGYGWRDIETGFRSPDGKFWLASGNFDVRNSGSSTMQEAIDRVKKNANTCIGESI
jgi:hypothetical protein